MAANDLADAGNGDGLPRFERRKQRLIFRQLFQHGKQDVHGFPPLKVKMRTAQRGDGSSHHRENCHMVYAAGGHIRQRNAP